MDSPPSVQVSLSMDSPPSDNDVKPENLEEAKEAGPSFHCQLFDAEMVHKIAETFLPGLASACVDNTTGGLLKSPASVAVDLRREMVDYLIQRSENFVAESVILEGGPDAEVSDDPYDIISDFIDDFASSKRNFFSRVSGWLLSDRRDDRIDDFAQEMEINGFWLMGRREAVAETLLKNVDFKDRFHCNLKFKSAEELAQHSANCSFRIVDCMNEGCNSRFSAAQMEHHDSTCPFKMLPCEQKCPEILMRREMDRHCITACPMKLVNCPFYAVGCLLTVPQSTIDQHRSENLHLHLLYILQSLHKETSVDNLKYRMEQLLKSSSDGHLERARDVRSLTYAVKQLEEKLGPLEVKKTDVPSESAELVIEGKESNTDPSVKLEESVKLSSTPEESTTSLHSDGAGHMDNMADSVPSVKVDGIMKSPQTGKSPESPIGSRSKDQEDKDKKDFSSKKEEKEEENIESPSKGKGHISPTSSRSLDESPKSPISSELLELPDAKVESVDMTVRSRGSVDSSSSDEGPKSPTEQNGSLKMHKELHSADTHDETEKGLESPAKKEVSKETESNDQEE